VIFTPTLEPLDASQDHLLGGAVEAANKGRLEEHHVQDLLGIIEDLDGKLERQITCTDGLQDRLDLDSQNPQSAPR
jgi:hypothetical protein